MSAASNDISELLHHPGIWRGGELAAIEAIASGFDVLDGTLPGGGWPIGALIELLPAAEGIGELALLMPALVRLSHGGHRGHRRIVWISPPHIPYAPALAAHGLALSRLTIVRAHQSAETLWAAEQSLRAGVFAAMLCWPAGADPRSLRRLQLAAGASHSLAVLLYPPGAAAGPSPAALRVALAPHENGLALHLLKCRGRTGGGDRLVLTAEAIAQCPKAPKPCSGSVCICPTSPWTCCSAAAT